MAGHGEAVQSLHGPSHCVPGLGHVVLSNGLLRDLRTKTEVQVAGPGLTDNTDLYVSWRDNAVLVQYY